jgi:cytochrome bd-type quinol oxidase subunit 2
VEDALAMVRTLRAEKVDVVLGSRFLGAAVGISGRKRLFLKAAAVFTRISTGLRVTDTHNGLRVLSRSAAAAIVIRQNRMAHASEILQQIADLGLAYAEGTDAHHLHQLLGGEGAEDVWRLRYPWRSAHTEIIQMIIQASLIFILVMLAIYALSQHKRAPVVSGLIFCGVMLGIGLVLFPEMTTHIAQRVGVGPRRRPGLLSVYIGCARGDLQLAFAHSCSHRGDR